MKATAFFKVFMRLRKVLGNGAFSLVPTPRSYVKGFEDFVDCCSRNVKNGDG